MTTKTEIGPQAITVKRLLGAAHEKPSYDLTESPWIPVVWRDGTVRDVSIKDFFTYAHEIRDLAESDHIARAALRRFTEALCVQLIRLTGPVRNMRDWRARAEERSGFRPSEITALIENQQDYLWLYHPKSPFLQDIRLIEALDSPELVSADNLIPNLPISSESAWFVKPGDRGQGRGLEAPAAARGLVARWFYYLPGNSAKVSFPTAGKSAGDTSGVQFGGAFSEGGATATHAFRLSKKSLASTLLRNITPGMVDADTQQGPAWAHEDRSAVSRDGLYTSTVTASSVILASPEEDACIYDLARGPVPQAKDMVKIGRDTAVAADAHRIVMDGVKKSYVMRREPSEHPLEILNFLHHAALTSGAGQEKLRGVINESDLWLTGAQGRHDEDIELFLAAKQGSSTSPKWAETRLVLLSAARIDQNSSEFRDLIPLLSTCFDEKSGITQKLRSAIRSALFIGQERSSKSVNRLAEMAKSQWLELAATRIETVINIGDEQDPLVFRRGLLDDACDVFDEVLAPYATSVRYAASIIQAKNRFLKELS